MDKVQELNQLIRAACPIIAINSAETQRVTDTVIDTVVYESKRTNKAHKKLFVWTVSRGLYRILTQAEAVKIGNENQHLLTGSSVLIREPNQNVNAEAFEVLQLIVKPDSPDGVYILKDMHHYLSNPAVLRALRDAAEILIKQRKTIILLSPHIDVPAEARKDVTVLDWPLPNAAEVAEIIETFIQENNVMNRLNGGMEMLIRNLQGLTAIEADQVLAKSVIAHGQLDEGCVEYVNEAKAEIMKAVNAFSYYLPKESDQVGGLDALWNWLELAGQANTPEARAFGIKPVRGVVVAGIPGCGKTLTAKALGRMWKTPVFILKFGALMGGLVGQTENQTLDAFKTIRAAGNCIVIMDEVEKALGTNSGGERDGNTSNRMDGIILTEMEECAESGAFFYATANEPWTLRPEFVRRFSEKFFVDVPGLDDRISIFDIHIRKGKHNPEDFDLEAIATAAQNLTGSEIEEVVQQALRQAFNAHREVTTADFVSIAESTIRLLDSWSEKIGKIKDWASRAKPASSKLSEASPLQVEPVGGRALEM